MKDSSNIPVLLIVGFVAIVAIVVMLFAPSIVNNFSDAVGFTAHSVYPSFAAPESRLSINNNLLSVSDYAVYKIGYYSVNGNAWQNFTLTGTTLSGNWLSSTATYTLPNFGSGESYVVIYSCSKNNGVWDCHDGTTGKWQLQIINNTVPSNTISPIINFIPPTPNNAATITTSNTEITANITDDSSAISSWIDFDKSLVGYWSMDYSSSSGIFDNSSYKNFGTFNGGLNYSNLTTGVRGQALKFDGVNDYLNIGSASSITPSIITVSAWVKASTNPVDYAEIIRYRTYGYFLGYNHLGTGSFSIYDSAATEYNAVDTTYSVTDNAWHHLVGVYNGSRIKFYLDGVLNDDQPAGVLFYGGGGSASIGRDGNADDSYVNGSLDEVMIFNRALSASEVKALYDSKLNKFDATFSNLANGLHSYTVYALDGSGNLVSSGQRTFNVNATITCVSSCSNKQCGSDGCGSNNNCGTCSNSHGTTSCSSSGLCQPSCSSGYANCDGNNVNGCEMQLGTTTNCASCGNACIGGQTCTGGVCVSPTATCSDRIQNQGETGIDCGGPCSACATYLRTFYVSPSGVDGASGTSSSPWKTLAYACAHATTPGDIISVGVGTFVETDDCNLAVGVSIAGTGTGSVLESTKTGWTYIIYLQSSTENTAGNQSISNLKFDGTNTKYWAIYINQRGHINIHDCTFVNFTYGALDIRGQTDNNAPTTYAQGSQIYNNIFTDCGIYPRSPMNLNGQLDMLVHDNTITQTGRAFGTNGEAMAAHHNMGMKFYNNIVTTDPNMSEYPTDQAGVSTFVMELWDNDGGFEIYNNNFYNGCLDIAGYYETKGTYPYAVSVHNNTFSRAMGTIQKAAIELEMQNPFGDILIYNNWIENYARGITIYNEGVGTFSNIFIYYNVFNNIGTTNANNGNYDTWGIWCNGYFASTINNLNIWNNIIIGHVGGSATGGIGFVGEGAYTNVSIKNNIIMNFIGQAGIYSLGGSGLSEDHFTINNNDFYNNGYGNVVQNQGITPTNSNETSGNIITIPGFISSSNLALAAGSGCINAGTNVGLTTDYLGHSIVGAPDIGAYEYHP